MLSLFDMSWNLDFCSSHGRLCYFMKAQKPERNECLTLVLFKAYGAVRMES